MADADYRLAGAEFDDTPSFDSDEPEDEETPDEFDGEEDDEGVD